MAKIYVELRSGLGNQLFQFAFGYRLASVYRAQLILCPSYFDPPLKFWLKKLMGKEARKLRLPLVVETGTTLSIQLPEKIKDKQLLRLEEGKHTITSINEACAKGVDIYLKGYWQNPEHILDIQQDLVRAIRPQFELSASARRLLDTIDSSSVAIHVRRGDFLTNRAFGACSLSFYSRAIDYMRTSMKNPKFVVFTNDRSWVKKNFAFEGCQIYANSSSPNTDIEEFYLMTKFPSLIISNSTFSWWSAFLNSAEPLVCAPQHWFLSTKLTAMVGNLSMNGWTVLDNELELLPQA